MLRMRDQPNGQSGCSTLKRRRQRKDIYCQATTTVSSSRDAWAAELMFRFAGERDAFVEPRNAVTFSPGLRARGSSLRVVAFLSEIGSIKEKRRKQGGSEWRKKRGYKVRPPGPRQARRTDVGRHSRRACG